MTNVLIIDNYDSFTFNLYDLVGRVVGRPPTVVTNDALSMGDLRQMDIDAVIISPGPGHPGRRRDFGVCREVITSINRPVLGVCLGHQGIAHAFGAAVEHAPDPMHGRTSRVFHDGVDIFEGIPGGFRAVRYHSLMVLGALPEELVVNAWTSDGVPMAVRHRHLPLRGVQFHPESVLTEHGERLIHNFLRLVSRPRRRSSGRPTTANGPKTTFKGSPKKEPPGRGDGTLRSEALRSEAPWSETPWSETPWEVSWRRVADWVEPEAVFCSQYADAKNSYWLDSSMAQPGLSRFSFMGTADGPEAFVARYHMRTRMVAVDRRRTTTSYAGTIFEFLQQQLGSKTCQSRLPFEFTGGFVGWFGYELKGDCGFASRHESCVPDAAVIFSDRIVAFDHAHKAVYLVALHRHVDWGDSQQWLADMSRRLDGVAPPPPVVADVGAHENTFSLRRDGPGYLDDIAHCLQEIGDGESYEICLTNMFTTRGTRRPLDLYRILRRVSPAPYAAYLHFDDVTVLSSSPERFLTVDANRRVSSKPIKGTAPRAPDRARDDEARLRLASSTKDAAENLMIVDLIRNDLGRVCQIGTIEVPKLMAVESYATVHQLVSTVTGRLRPGATSIDCLRAAFPGGSMTGAPKARTIEILDGLEKGPRGIYSGAIGWLGVDGTADLSIVIRTAVVTADETTFGVGGAIVALSNPEQELEECVLKGVAIIRSMLLLGNAEFRPDMLPGLGISGTELNRIAAAQAPVADAERRLRQLLGSTS